MKALIIALLLLTCASGAHATDPIDGELCIVTDPKGGSMTNNCNGSVPIHYDAAKTSLSCTRNGLKNSNATPCIKAGDTPQTCYADFECCTGYCDFKKADIDIDGVYPAGSHGTCQTPPSSAFATKAPKGKRPYYDNDKRLSIMPPGPTGLAVLLLRGGDACTSHKECESGVCKSGKCERAKYCMRCTLKDFQPSAGAPCCDGLGVANGGNTCVEVPNLTNAVNISDLVGLKDDLDPTSSILRDKWDISIADSAKSCEFSWSLNGVVDTAGKYDPNSVRMRIRKELIARTSLLEILKFIYTFEDVKDPTRIPFDPYGMHKTVKDLMFQLQVSDALNFKNLRDQEKFNQTILDLETFRLFMVSHQSDKYYADKITGKLTADQIAEIYKELYSGTALNTVYHTGPTDIKIFLNDPINLPILDYLRQALIDPNTSGIKGLQEAALTMVMTTSINTADSMFKKAAALGALGDAIGKDGEGTAAFATPSHYEAGNSSQYGTEKYNLKDMITGRGNMIRNSQQKSAANNDQEELEEDDGCEACNDQTNAFYNSLKNFRCDGDIESLDEADENTANEAEWAEEAPPGVSWHTFFCRGTGSGTGNNQAQGGYRIGGRIDVAKGDFGSYISTFPAYVFSPAGVAANDSAAAISNVQQNLKLYIERPLQHTREAKSHSDLKDMINSYELNNEMKNYLKNISDKPELLTAILKYMSASSTKNSDGNDPEPTHPLRYAPEFLLFMNDFNVSVLGQYYLKMQIAFEKRAACLDDLIKNLKKDLCPPGQKCGGVTSTGSVTPPKAKPIALAKAANPGVDTSAADKTLTDVNPFNFNSLGNFNSGSSLSSGGLGKVNARNISDKLGKAFSGRLSSGLARLASARKARKDFLDKWGKSRYARSNNAKSYELGEGVGKLVGDEVRAAVLKTINSKESGSSAATSAVSAPANDSAKDATDKKEEEKAKAAGSSGGSLGLDGIGQNGSYRGNSYNSGGNGHNNLAKASKDTLVKDAKKDEKKFGNQEGDSIFKIITNRYMKSLDRILPSN